MSSEFFSLALFIGCLYWSQELVSCPVAFYATLIFIYFLKLLARGYKFALS